MCEFCEDKFPRTPTMCDTPDMDTEARIEALFNIDTLKRTHYLVVTNIHTDSEAYFHINFCPICGRNLSGKEQ